MTRTAAQAVPAAKRLPAKTHLMTLLAASVSLPLMGGRELTSALLPVAILACSGSLLSSLAPLP